MRKHNWTRENAINVNFYLLTIRIGNKIGKSNTVNILLTIVVWHDAMQSMKINGYFDENVYFLHKHTC